MNSIYKCGHNYFDMTISNKESAEAQNLFKEFGLNNYISGPTCITKTPKRGMVSMFSNTEAISSTIVNTHLSDHTFQTCSFQVSVKLTSGTDTNKRDYPESYLNSFRNQLKMDE